MMKAAIYARFSTQMQREASIEDQVRLCRERAEREGWEVGQIYSDAGISGASLLRPGVQALSNDAAGGVADIVLVEALDRLSRDQADVTMIFKRLSFAGARIVTLAEGEIGELHVGLKGTMNQLFLKDLADKTRRGLRGRVEQGRSGGGNAYGYRVVHLPGTDGETERGGREIDPAQAEIVRRIFRDFAAGHSPKAIARALNAEGVPGPRGALWRDTAIRGHRQRGTGFLNNELYIGRLIWNRLRYIKDPETGKRVSRANPPEDWIVTEVPDLRIVDQNLWEAVKARQAEIDTDPRVKGIKESRFWERRRTKHLLAGLVHCGGCGGRLAAVGRDYLACSDARKLGTCDQRKGVKRSLLEEVVLDLLRSRLMQPDAVEAFVRAYQEGETARAREAETGARQAARELQTVSRKLQGLYDAIADGLRTPGLKAQLEELEVRKAALERAVAAADPNPVRFHPKLPELYREKVRALGESLRDPEIRQPALEAIRGLIERITLHAGEDGLTVELEGALTAMLGLADGGESHAADASSVKVVAGVGFEPTTFRL